MTRARRHFFERIGGALLATILIAPVIGAVWPQLKFHAVTSRVFLGSLLVAFAIRQPGLRDWRAGFRSMGLRGPSRARRMAVGATFSMAALALALLISWGLGGRAAHLKPSAPSLLLLVLYAAIGAPLISFVEETFFRGYVKDLFGGLPSAALYAVVHYLRPRHGSEPVDGYEPLAVIERLPGFFDQFLDPRTALFGVPALFVLGMALNRLRERTGTLYFGVGIHAGFVFVLKLYGQWLSTTPEGDKWIFGGVRLYDGAIGGGALVALLAFAHAAPLPRWLRQGWGKPQKRRIAESEQK